MNPLCRTNLICHFTAMQCMAGTAIEARVGSVITSNTSSARLLAPAEAVTAVRWLHSEPGNARAWFLRALLAVQSAAAGGPRSGVGRALAWSKAALRVVARQEDTEVRGLVIKHARASRGKTNKVGHHEDEILSTPLIELWYLVLKVVFLCTILTERELNKRAPDLVSLRIFVLLTCSCCVRLNSICEPVSHSPPVIPCRSLRR